MPDIFSKIGQLIRSGVAGGGTAQSLDKLTVLSTLEELDSSFTALSGIFQSPTLIRVLQAPSTNPTLASAQAFNKVYTTFENGLTGAAATMERHGKFSTVVLAANIVQADIKAILSHFDDLFGNSDATLAVSDFRISTAAALGYMENSFGFLRWLTYMINMAISAQNSDQTPVPPYQFTEAYSLTPIATKVCDAAVRNGTKIGFIDRVKSIRAAGKDVLLTSNGATLDQYTGVNNYDSTTLSHVGGFIPNIGMMFGKYSIERQRVQLEEMKHIQNWLRNKISLLQLDMNRSDPNSPEYRRAKALVDNYMKDLSATDKKLAVLNG